MKIEMIHYEKLKINPRNARNNDRAVVDLAKLLLRHGWQSNLVAGEDFIIESGNTRLKAVRYLHKNWNLILNTFGLVAKDSKDQAVKNRYEYLVGKGPSEFDLVPVQIYKTSQTERDAYQLSDNASSEIASWNKPQKERILTEIRKTNKALTFMAIKPKKLHKYTSKIIQKTIKPEREQRKFKKFSKGMIVDGDVVKIGNHFLFCGDSQDDKTYDKIKEFYPGKFDFVLSRPFKAVQLNSTEDIENMYMSLQRTSGCLFNRLSPGGMAAFNFVDLYTYPQGGEGVRIEPLGRLYDEAFTEYGWTFIDQRILLKPLNRTFSPWTSKTPRSASNWEYLFVYKIPGKFRVGGSENSVNGYWNYNWKGLDEGGLKEAQDSRSGMPLTWVVNAITTYSLEGDIVLDPFCSKGATLVGAQKTGRIGIGIDIDPIKVYATALRLANEMGLNELCISRGKKEICLKI